MVNKGNNNNKKIRNTEKYAFILLVSGYISGLCIGAFFVFSNNANAAFTNSVVNHNDLYVLTVFIIALILKYSGILSGVMCTLPVFLGICNSAILPASVLHTLPVSDAVPYEFLQVCKQ